jgi:hypothetical protein
MLAGCKKKVESLQELPSVDLLPEKKISQFNDSLFVSEQENIVHYKNRFYLADRKSQSIYVLDSSFRFIRSIGRAGKGPGEFTRIAKLSIQNDTIFANDDGGHRINRFTIEGNNLPEIQLGMSFNGFKYIIDGHTIYGSNTHMPNTTPIKKCIIKGEEIEVIKQFGEMHPQTANFDMQKKVNYHLLSTPERNIIAVGDMTPYVAMYNLNGDLLGKCDLTRYKVFDKRIKDALKKYKEGKKGSYFFTSEIDYIDGLLYILIVDFVKETPTSGDFDNNKILVARIEGEEIKPEKIFVLKGNNDKDGAYYGSFGIYKSGGKIKLVTFDYVSFQLHVYTL